MDSNGARRARKRPILRVVLVLFALVAAWFSWEVYRALTAKPFIEIDYAAKMEELILSYHEDPSAPNGWPVFEEAMAIFDDVVAVYDRNDDGPNGNLYLLLDTVYSSYSWTDTEDVTLEMVRDNAIDALAAMEQAGLYDKLDQLTLVQTARRSTPTGLMTGLLDDLSTSRRLARAFKARMVLARERDDTAEFIRAFKHCLALAKVQGMQGDTISGLTAVAIESLALGELRSSLTDRTFDERILGELAAIMDQQLMQGLGELLFEIERLRLLDFVQAISTKDGRLLLTEADNYTRSSLGFGPAMPGVAEYQLSNLASVVLPRKPDVEEKINEYFGGCIDRMNIPFTERTNDVFDPETFAENLSIRYFLFKPSFGPANLGDVWDHQELQRRGTYLMLAIETHKVRHGAYPASLEDLDPTILEEPPRDPYGTGPLVYRLFTPGEDEHNRPYLLYSIGKDMTNNGGKTHEDGPREAIWREGQVGYDYVLNDVSEDDEDE